VYQPLSEANGHISGVIAVANEITKQVEARQAVEESEAKLRSLVESAPFPIGVYVGREMRIQLANQSIMDIWAKGNDVVGKLYTDILPELENQAIFDQLDRVYTTGIPFHAHHQQVDLVVDGKLQPYYFNYSFTPLYDTHGQIYGVMNTAAEVTDLVLAQKKIAESEQTLRNIILQAPVAMCLLRGPGHVIEIANERMFQIWGLPPEEMLEKPLFEALPDGINQAYAAHLHRVYTTGETFSALSVPATVIREGTKETIYTDLVYQAQRADDGSISGIVAVHTDVTGQVLARKELEESQQAAYRWAQELALANEEIAASNEDLGRANTQLVRINNELDTFIYTASHDLKSPILNIEGLLKALERELKKEHPQAGHIAQLNSFLLESVSRFKTTIRDLTDVARISKESTEDIEHISLAAMLEEVVLDLAMPIREAQARLETDLDGEQVRFSRKNLKSILYNLLSNAIKYRSPDREPLIRITCQLQENYQILSVTDNGLGMDLLQEEKIFALFKRLHTHVEGTGIGLYMVKKMLENAGGMIQVESQVGVGSTFKVYFKR
jgi:PAS domain S-box-containing protein